MVIKMENDFDGSTPTCEKPKKSFSCASHRNLASSRFFRLLAFLFQFGAKPKPLSIASAEVSFEL